MLTSKQRACLRSLAQKIEPVAQFGKQGLSEAFTDGLILAIEKRELIKVTVLENSGYEPREAGDAIAERIGAEFVCATGRKLVFYKRSYRTDVEHIEI
ncbi:MAG: YhbY family RNA-binding protein [Clostridia bacterium]|nr:YhbY family RNA-binding protein [Clostridia bacterium]